MTFAEQFTTILNIIANKFKGLATVANTGSYNDLKDKPTISTVDNITELNVWETDPVEYFNTVYASASEVSTASVEDDGLATVGITGI